MRTAKAPANGVILAGAAADQVLRAGAATSGGKGHREEPRLQKGRLWRFSLGQRLAQSPKYLRPGFEEEAEELGGAAAGAYEV